MPFTDGSEHARSYTASMSGPFGVIFTGTISMPNVRQIVKPVIEILAAIPSVAYGFFALVVFAPLLQNHGGLVRAATAAEFRVASDVREMEFA